MMNRKQRRTLGKNGPIMSQEEYNESFEYLVTTTQKVIKISEDEARRRVTALMATDILSDVATEQIAQMRIDMFLAIPSRDHGKPLPFFLQSFAYQEAFDFTLSKQEIVEQYDRLKGANLGHLISIRFKDAENNAVDPKTGKLGGELAKFERFFREFIWSRFNQTTTSTN